MIKCENCGGSLSLEHKFCPHCGQENKQAAQHIQQMEAYKDQFEETREEVYRASRKMGEIVVRALILAGLLIAFVVLVFMNANAYSWQRQAGRREAEKHYAEYSAQIEAYLEAEDFLALKGYIEGKTIPEYDSPKYEPYVPIFRAVKNYGSMYYFMQDFVDGTITADRQQRQLGYLADAMDYFYDNLNLEKYAYCQNIDEQKVLEVYDKLDEYTQVLLMGNFGFSKEEASQFRTMTSAKRRISLEEKLLHEEE